LPDLFEPELRTADKKSQLYIVLFVLNQTLICSLLIPMSYENQEIGRSHRRQAHQQARSVIKRQKQCNKEDKSYERDIKATTTSGDREKVILRDFFFFFSIVNIFICRVSR
jgi:hypothetical protein